MIDYQQVLDDLNIELTAKRGSEVQGFCPKHKDRTGQEDHNPSWWFNIESGAHLCFSCGYKGNVFTLISDLRGVDYEEAKSLIGEHLEAPVDAILIKLQRLPEFIRPEVNLSLSDSHLAIFTAPPLEELQARRVTREAAHACGVLWNPKQKTWIFPLKDPYEYGLWGWQEKGAHSRFFKNHPQGMKKSKTVFNVENLNTDLLIVVESPLDVAVLYDAGYPGAVATCGALPSEEQFKIISRSSKVIAAFDKDDAGNHANDIMLNFAKKYGVELSFFNYQGVDCKDPGEMDVQSIHSSVDTAVDRIYGKRGYAWS